MKTDELLRQLRRDLAKLDGTEERPIARRNARRRVLGSLRRIRAYVDESFPAIVDRTGTKRLTVEGRVKRLERAGWTYMGQIPWATICATVGVPAKPHPSGNGQGIWIPGWARAIGPDPSKLRAAVKSVTIRRAALATQALLRGAA
jgi:hypothetical protein